MSSDISRMPLRKRLNLVLNKIVQLQLHYKYLSDNDSYKKLLTLGRETSKKLKLTEQDIIAVECAYMVLKKKENIDQ